MEAAAATATSPDVELEARAHDDGPRAFVSLCQPHFEGLFDFALRVVRDREVAASVLRNTVAWASSTARPPEPTKPWLYGMARACALGGLRYKKRPSRWREDTREGLEFTRVDPDRLSDPAVLFDKELIELVWDSAVAMDVDDYSFLDLRVRQALSPAEIAEQLHLRADALGPKLERLRETFDDSVIAVLLARRAQGSCARLDTVLSQLGENDATPNVRRAVQRHVGECQQCRESKRRFASPTEILASFVPMPPPPSLQEEFLGRLAGSSNGRVSSSRLCRLFFRHPVRTPGG